MVESIVSEEIAAGAGLSLSQAAKRFPSSRLGKPVTLSCLLRWVLDGVLVQDRRIRLEAARLAGRWITTPGAIRRFIEGQTPALDTDATPVPRSPANRQRASDRAAAALEKIGI